MYCRSWFFSTIHIRLWKRGFFSPHCAFQFHFARWIEWETGKISCHMQFSSHYIRRYFNAENGKEPRPKRKRVTMNLSQFQPFIISLLGFSMYAFFFLSVCLDKYFLLACLLSLVLSTSLVCHFVSFSLSLFSVSPLFFHSVYGIARCSNACTFNGIARRAVRLKMK